MYVVRASSQRIHPLPARWMALAVLLLSLTSSHTSAQGNPPGELAAGQFLIASRGLLDPNFAKTVVLLIAHNDEGAMGVIINRPTEVELGQMIGELEDAEARARPVWVGGPVAHWQLVLLFRSDEGSDQDEPVFEDVYFSASREVLEGLLERGMEFRIYAGYAGWAPGQLESERDRGDWHVLKADAETVFDRSSPEIWPELIHRLKVEWVDLNIPLLTGDDPG